jgi:lysophospholipase L1-like esterase
VGRVSTRAPAPASAYAAFEVSDASHQVELRAAGDGEIRIFGMTLDRAQPGVVVDAVGINGAVIFTPLRWSESHFVEQLRHRAPDLVVLAYGTNESLDTTLTDADYERAITSLLGRIGRATPAAGCLLLGPTDRATRAGTSDVWFSAPRVAELVEVERRVARTAGCAFYDQLEAMGGLGSMVAWAAEPDPRGGRDRVHFTRSGYALLGRLFADDLLRAYDAWRAERGLAPTGVAPASGVAVK